MKTYQQKYDEAWSAAQAGGMTSGDSHNFAVDQASRPVKEIKHTPGPWKAEGSLIIDGNRPAWQLKIAILPTTIDPRPTPDAAATSLEQRDANAALIAAAPSLLQELLNDKHTLSRLWAILNIVLEGGWSAAELGERKLITEAITLISSRCAPIDAVIKSAGGGK